MIPRAKFLIR